MLRVYFTENFEGETMRPSYVFDYVYKPSWFTPAVRELVREVEHVDLDDIDPRRLSEGAKALILYKLGAGHIFDIKWFSPEQRHYLQSIAREHGSVSCSVVCHQSDFVLEGSFVDATTGNEFTSQYEWNCLYSDACWGVAKMVEDGVLKLGNSRYNFSIPLNERFIVCHMDDRNDTLFLDMMHLALQHKYTTTGIQIESPCKSICMLDVDSDWRMILKQDVKGGILIADYCCAYVHEEPLFNELFKKSDWTLIYFSWCEHSLGTNYYKKVEDSVICYKPDRPCPPTNDFGVYLRSDFSVPECSIADGVIIYEYPFYVDREKWSEANKDIYGLAVVDADFLNPNLSAYVKLIAASSTPEANEALLDLKWDNHFKFPVTEIIGRGKR